MTMNDDDDDDDDDGVSDCLTYGTVLPLHGVRGEGYEVKYGQEKGIV